MSSQKTQGFKEPADILICSAECLVETGEAAVWGAAAMSPVSIGKRVLVRVDINHGGIYGAVTRLHEGQSRHADFPHLFEYESDRDRDERLKREAEDRNPPTND